MTDTALSASTLAPLAPPAGLVGSMPIQGPGAEAGNNRHVLLRRAAIASVLVSLLVAALLAVLHRTLGGPGDEILYYSQATRLLPFTDHYYGPGYFIALRLLRTITGLSWFGTGKLLSWLSAVGFLVVSARVLLRSLPRPYGYPAIILVALNATQIAMSYSSLTISFGAFFVIFAIAALPHDGSNDVRASAAGLLFALAVLTRFQANAFALGAVVGLLFWNGDSWQRRAKQSAFFVVAFVVPVAAWYLFLRLVQGGAPVNYNFIHLTRALGQFQSFKEVTGLVRRYGSMRGVLATPGVPLAIARMAVVEVVRFPFRTGLQLLLLNTAWLLPGVCIVLSDPTLRRPWVAAMAVGFVATNIGSREWIHYYTPLLPFFAFLICTAAAALDRSMTVVGRGLQWIIILGIPLAAAPVLVRQDFHDVEWPEWRTARAFVMRTMQPGDVVSSTASSLEYGTPMHFVDLDDIYTSPALDSLMPILRANHVTRLVVTERHSLFEHAQLAPLLGDDPSGIPPGLRRDTLIVQPKRVAIFTVLRQPD